jgi:hypothetical protein
VRPCKKIQKNYYILPVYRTLKPVEVTIRREWSKRENKGQDELIQEIIHEYLEISQ